MRMGVATGYAGKALHINLTARRHWVESLSDDVLRRYLGGVGLATYLLYKHLPPRTDPLRPDNVLVFAPGPFAGSPVPAGAKHAVATKSPLTGFIGDSLSGSYWSYEIRRAGYDALIVHGRAASPTYVFVDDDAVHFRDASHLLGLDGQATEAAIREELGDKKVRVASIGIAGEKMVLYASLGNDKGRQAGRTGPGAVMGSKNLKAIALRGSGRLGIAEPLVLDAIVRDMQKKVLGPATAKYRVLGTNANVMVLNRMGILPTRNFKQATFDSAELVSAEHAQATYKERRASCFGCPVGCDHIVEITGEGPLAGAKGSAEYESTYALGACCGISDYAVVIKATELCDRYGLDTISTGVTIAWAMECYERGILTREDTGGLDLRFGNAEAQLALIPMIARREGIGDLLADGVRRASQRVGGGSEEFAMHVKGLELPGYDPRGLKTFALGLAVSPRGACHNRSAAYEADMKGIVDRFRAEPGRGQLAAAQEDYATVFDALALCKFTRGCYEDFYAEAARMASAVTGVQFSADDLRLAGERINNLKKLFNIREGWQPADDWLPPRLLNEALAGEEGSRLTDDELRMMIDDYYQARGWTADGFIPLEKLQELGLHELAVNVVTP